MLLNGLDEVAGIKQALMRTCIEPCKTSSEDLNIELALLKIDTVKIRDLEFASRRRLQVLSILNYIVIVEIKSRYAVIALGMLGFLLNRYRPPVLIEFDDSESLGILDIIAEHRSASALLGIIYGSLKLKAEAVTCEDIVTQNHSYLIVADEFLAEDKCLCKSVGRRLNLIGQ